MIGRWHARSKRHSNACRDFRVSSLFNHRANRWNLFYGSLDDEYFIDVNKQIAESMQVAAMCAVEILELLKECREDH